MIFSWFDTHAAKVFGCELADFYISRAGKKAENASNKTIEKKQRELLTKISQKIDLFKSCHALNILKRAQLGSAFKWRLLDAGLDKSQVDELTSWVTRQL
jgi:hypothetical protein